LATGLVLLAFAASAQNASIEPYRVGNYDVLALSIWQQPELDRALNVDENGHVTVPLIGVVEADGRTLVDLEAEILERIQVYHRDVTRVSLEVTEFNSKAVYVLGAVTIPGKYAVYPVPNIWQAIREAGGITPEGDLSRVRLYREVDGQQVLETYNLQALLNAEGVLDVPSLASGETVEVPRRPVIPGTYSGRDGVYVLGQVLTPGIYRIEPGSQDLLGFILQAGGPLDAADLGDVLLLRTRADGSLLRYRLDLARYLDSADAQSNPLVLPGDTIFVPREAQVSRIINNNLAILTGLATLLTSALLITQTR